MSLHLYHMTLQRAGAVTHSVSGKIVGDGNEQVLVARGHILELLSTDANGSVQTLLSLDIFGVVRSMVTFRLHGTNKDYVLIGSDSGKITILEYNALKNNFTKVQEETFGRSGSRRIVPGQFLASDPAGRAVMIGAIEKQKFVYILNHESNTTAVKLTISSPLEAHKSLTFVHDLTAVDVGFLNPQFVTVELDYTDVDTDPTGAAAQQASKQLVFYELDLGLNHVVRKSSEAIDPTAHKLITVLGATGNRPSQNPNVKAESYPGGIIICAKSTLYYRTPKGVLFKVPIPRRLHTTMTGSKGEADEGVIFTNHVECRFLPPGASEWQWFYLIQTEHGDLFCAKIIHSSDEIKDFQVFYCATLPPCSSLALADTTLWAFCESGNTNVYVMLDIPSEAEDAFTFVQENGMQVDSSNLFFKPRPQEWLALAQSVPGLAPILDLKVARLKNHDSPHILALCGNGARSSLSILKHGLQASAVGGISLGAVATSIWSIKFDDEAGGFDKYIAISFSNATWMLTCNITDDSQKIEELKEGDPLFGKFISNSATLNIGRFGSGAILQVHVGGIRYVHSNFKSIQELPCPSDSKVVLSTMNDQQVALALKGTSGGSNLIYYELDPSNKLTSPKTFHVAGEILALSLPPQRIRGSPFLAVAIAMGTESKIHIYSMASNSMMTILSVQMCLWRVSSLALLPISGSSTYIDTTPTTTSKASSSLSSNQAPLVLGVGAANGIFSRFMVDRNTGALSDGRDKVLGSKPVKLYHMNLSKEGLALIATSSRPWMLHQHRTGIRLLPICESFDHAATFHIPHAPHSLITINGSSVNIIHISGFDQSFSRQEIRLNYTPRQSCVIPGRSHLVIAESDHNSNDVETRQRLEHEVLVQHSAGELSMADYGAPKPGPSRWGSCLRLLDFESGEVLDLISIEENECAISICATTFADHGNEVFICVGTVKDMSLLPKRKFSAAFIHLYSFEDQGRRLKLLHKKAIDDVPGALVGFHGRLVAGIGKSLSIFDLGIKKPQLLKKCENGSFPNQIVSLQTSRDRIIVGDIQESIFFVKYSQPDTITIFADDVSPKWVTSIEMLDYNTSALSDKFGNVFVLRLPEKVSKAENEQGSIASPWSQSYRGAPSHKLESPCVFYLGETATRLKRASLAVGGTEFILYATMFGTIGALIPISSSGTVEFLSQFEVLMRQEAPPLCGRDHLAYRSSYFPVRNVIDGDLLEQFPTIPRSKQDAIADSLEYSIAELQRKIEDFRGSL